MTKKKTKKTNTIVEEIEKPIAVVIGHDVPAMKYMIDRYTESNCDVLVSTFERYAEEFDLEVGKGFVQQRPPMIGVDCLKLVLAALKPIFYAVTKGRTIQSIGSCFTEATTWDYNLTCEEWEKLFDIEPDTKEYVKDLIEKRYKELYGTEDSDI